MSPSIQTYLKRSAAVWALTLLVGSALIWSLTPERAGWFGVGVCLMGAVAMLKGAVLTHYHDRRDVRVVAAMGVGMLLRLLAAAAGAWFAFGAGFDAGAGYALGVVVGFIVLQICESVWFWKRGRVLQPAS